MDRLQGCLDRPRLYYNIDGVGELGIGVMCLGFAVLGWLQLHAPRTSIWHQMYTFVIYMAALVFLIHYGSKFIKKHLTYPRTGFVEYRKWERVSIWIATLVCSALASLGWNIVFERHWEISVPGSLVGLLFAAAYIRIARTARWKWAVFWAMIAGTLVIAALPPDRLAAYANHAGLTSAVPARVVGAYWLTVALFGFLSLISGGISFWLYLRHTQPPAQEGR